MSVASIDKLQSTPYVPNNFSWLSCDIPSNGQHYLTVRNLDHFNYFIDVGIQLDSTVQLVELEIT